MPSTHKFSELRSTARRDPARAKRIDAAKVRALDEHAAYRARRAPSSPRGHPGRADRQVPVGGVPDRDR